MFIFNNLNLYTVILCKYSHSIDKVILPLHLHIKIKKDDEN